MRQPRDHPVACLLSGAELRERLATLLAFFRTTVIKVETTEDGYAFQIPGDAKSIALATQLVLAERQCCPFLNFELRDSPDPSFAVLRISAPIEAREFLKNIFLP